MTLHGDSSQVLGDLIRLLDAAYDLRRQIDSWARDAYGLPLSQLMTLLAVAQLGGTANVSMIARAVGRKSHTVTVVIDVLEQKGYVLRNRSLHGDRRTVAVTLTRMGMDLAASDAPGKNGGRLPISSAERAQVHEVADLLERLVDSTR